MYLDLKKILNIIVLFFGSIVFLWFLRGNNLNMAIIALSITLIIWLLISLISENFNLKHFAWIVSCSGFLLSVSIFFLFGVEEVPFPVGAITFHSGGIASAIGVGFFSIFPLLILYQGFPKTSNENKLTSDKHDDSEIDKNEQITPVIDSDDWEIVSEDDLHSGEYEI